MKKLFLLTFLSFSLTIFAQNKTENVILVTLDGYRWQELYEGLDKKWVTKKFVRNIDALKAQFDAPTPEARREKLMPFFWNTIAKQGTLIGNRKKKSEMDVTNGHKFSYPGYSEIFCGYGDKKVNSNEYPDNPNTNIFDFISAQNGFENKCAAIATWNAFPRIINSNRNKVPVYVNITPGNSVASSNNLSFESWQTTRPDIDTFILNDTITYHFAKEYLHRFHPRFAFIGFDETDHFSHGGRYDAYLNAAHTIDKFIEDLWNFIQSDPQYKNKTTLIITTDHGRGHRRPEMWRHHGKVIANAHHIWLAVIGPDVPANGEVSSGKKYYQKQIAQTIAHLLGKTYTDTHPVGEAIDILLK